MRIILFFLLINVGSYAQSNRYFQQKVDTKINVVLNTNDNTLDCFEKIVYTNHSPQALAEIYFLLYPNAYNGTNTKFAMQQLQNNSTKFHRTSDKNLGKIRVNEVKIDSTALEMIIDEKNNDLGKITLLKPLQSGDSAIFIIDFKVKIPKVFSRFGFDNDIYACTQWYVKPAVYDAYGWHKYPYLDQGEFYYEYGNYDVSITLPANYKVGATGVLQNSDERNWLLDIANDKEVAYRDGNKTVQFKAENVHDFAFFASEKFKVMHDTTMLKSKRIVDVWSFYESDSWKNALLFIKHTLHTYGKWIGEYPYPQCTAVEGPLSAGGGMEYPMITIVGGNMKSERSVRDVIIHEVGHNWFQGILGNNERLYPWQDEGFNSYYDARSSSMFKKDTNNTTLRIGVFRSPKLSNFSLSKFGLHYFTNLNKTQAQKLSSEKLQYINYGLLSYQRTANLLNYLESFLGQETLDACFQNYFNKWKFKHPQPNDVKQAFEEVAKKDLSWFFNDLLLEKKSTDIKLIKKTSEGFVVKNTGSIALPINLGAYNKEGNLLSSVCSNEVVYPGDNYLIKNNTEAYKFKIDYDNSVNEQNERNNTYFTHSLFKRNPVQINVLATKDISEEKNHLFVAPVLGYNAHNKFMLGASFYNRLIMPRTFEFMLTPMYSFNTKTLAGSGTMSYYFHPYNSGSLQGVEFNVAGKTFADNFYNSRFVNSENNKDYYSHYYKISPKIVFTFANNNTNNNIEHKLTYQYNYIQDEYTYDRRNDIDTNIIDLIKDRNYFYNNVLSYEYINRNVLVPNNTNITFEYAQNLAKVSITEKFQFHVPWNKKNARARVFAGKFLLRKYDIDNNDYTAYFNNRMDFRASGNGTLTDAMYDEYMLARNVDRGFWQNQIEEKDGFFKANIQDYTGINTSKDLMVAANIVLPLPKIPIVRAYADWLYMYQPDGPLKESFTATNLYNVGFMLDIIPNMVEIYVPIVYTKKEKELQFIQYQSKKFIDRITFRINLKEMNIWKKARNINVNL